MTMPNPHWLWTVCAWGLPFVLGQDYPHGTAIAVIRTDTEIVIAADSRAKSGTGQRQPDACKICPFGKYFVSAHGIAGTDAILSAASRALDGSDSLARKLSLIRDAIAPLIRKAIQAEAAAREINSGVIVMGFEDNVLQLGYVGFTPTLSDGVYVATPEIHICPPECTRDRVGSFFVSPDKAIFDDTGDPLKAVKQFVRKEIAAARSERDTKTVSDVGGPIQILRIESNGRSHWIKKPKICKRQK